MGAHPMRLKKLLPVLIATWLAFPCLWAGAMPIPEKLITLDGLEMARLRTAIVLPRPDVLVTITGVYVHDLSGSPRNPRATFQTDAFDTGPGYRRHRLGSCELAQSANWICDYRDRLTRVISEMTITARLPVDMRTELAIRVLEFAVPLINQGARSEREFSVHEFRDEISISFGSGCSTSMKFRRKGETFEKVPMQFYEGVVCH